MTVLLVLGGLFLLLFIWFRSRRTVSVPCELELERTHEYLCAHLDLIGEQVEPGDSVLIDDAPDRIEYGEVRKVQSTATVRHASWLRRTWTRVFGRFNIHELYDVGFE